MARPTGSHDRLPCALRTEIAILNLLFNQTATELRILTWWRNRGR
jgi:hypothetical protein